MVEEKRTVINFSDIVKERLEENSYKCEFYNRDKFEFKLDKPDLITYKNAREEESLISVPDEELMLFHNDFLALFLFYHGKWDPNSKKPNRFGKIAGIFDSEPLKYKDELMFVFITPRVVKSNRWSWQRYQDGWYEYQWTAKYLKGKKVSPEFMKMTLEKSRIKGGK